MTAIFAVVSVGFAAYAMISGIWLMAKMFSCHMASWWSISPATRVPTLSMLMLAC